MAVPSPVGQPPAFGLSAGHHYLGPWPFRGSLSETTSSNSALPTTYAKFYLAANTPYYRDLLDTYTLFGDPATRLNVLPAEVQVGNETLGGQTGFTSGRPHHLHVELRQRRPGHCASRDDYRHAAHGPQCSLLDLQRKRDHGEGRQHVRLGRRGSAGGHGRRDHDHWDHQRGLPGHATQHGCDCDDVQGDRYHQQHEPVCRAGGGNHDGRQSHGSDN